jgi:hypothetical protein
MKIACMTFPPDGLMPLCRALKERGHDVKAFHTELPPEVRTAEPPPANHWDGFDVWYGRWDLMDLDAVHEFAPDILLIWNGTAPWSVESVDHLKTMYRAVHIEFAWLPQRGNYQISDALAPHSRFIMNVPEDYPVNEAGIAALKEYYQPKGFDPGLPERFILFPAQINSDTSIIRSSPFYKSCVAFLADLTKHITKVPIIVKPHPHDRWAKWPEGTLVYKGALSALDLVRQSSAVVGINSTVLTEALVHDKPVFSFGYNVAMRSHTSGVENLDHEAVFRRAQEVCLGDSYTPPKPANQTLSWLLSKQWPHMNPPSWVCEYIENFK